MFVLPPPPPRYTVPLAYAAGASNGMAVPVVETNNIISHPDGGSLQVGEGTYVLRDDLHLATPPPHPSEAPITNPNPLATVPTPPTSGVKLSLISLKPRKRVSPLYNLKLSHTGNSDLRSIRESDAGSADNGSRNGATPVFGDGNPALTPVVGGKDALKRRKPKNNIVKSSSSFVSRVITHEASAKRLSERDPDGLFAFANINRAFQWLDLSSKTKEEPLAKILFTKAHMLSHDVNELSKEKNHLDVVMGSSAGDILWYEPMQQKYARINKNGAINNSAVTHIAWLPGSESYFMAAHANGVLAVYDKEKEDALFVPEEPLPAVSDEEKNGDGQSPNKRFNILKSVNSKNQKTNPVALWKLSHERINSFAFSPDQRHLAIVLEDGSLRILDFLEEHLLDTYTSYYGGLICVCWSPDGKYILSGGQDDLVSIWSMAERKIIARCQGHNSWVSAVAFDPWRCDERNYRFGSVGDDCRLLLWDFSMGMLHRPKAAQVTARQRNSVVNAPSLRRYGTDGSGANRVRSDSDRTEKPVDDSPIVISHPVEPRARTAQLPPISNKVIGTDPICWLGFEEDCIFTSSLEGHIRTWDRPTESNVNASQLDVSSSSGAGDTRSKSGLSFDGVA